MRIDAYNQVSRLYTTTSKSKVSKSKSVDTTDRLEISQVGRDYQIAKSAVAAAADVREDRIAEVKAKYASGDYDIAAEELAAKLAEKYNTTLF